VQATAEILVEQLSAKGPKAIDVRENAAIALQVMGKNAAKALAKYIRSSLSEHNGGAIKAITVLGKIGNDIADDDDVRDALRSAASLEEKTDWPELQLAAIDALREINKYRGAILTLEDDNRPDTFDPGVAIGSADLLAQTAEKVFEKSTVRSLPTPTPTPPDEEFYAELKTLRDLQAKLLKAAVSQAKLVEAAAQVSAASSPSKPEEPVFSRLTDARTLAESLKRIEVGYSDATKTIDTTKLKLENTYDKTAWQFQTEAAYTLLTETSELRDQLHKAFDHFKKNQDDLATLVSRLATISATSNSYLINAAVASTLNGIFSKPPEKKSAAEAAKKDAEKKETDKKDAEKKEGAKKDAAKGDVKE
jgi:hypothetical protein